ncbi:MAG: glycosyltransferase [Bacteroidetes bacterium]|nr:glycosyltransferase [Bacteroidota bacterium]
MKTEVHLSVVIPCYNPQKGWVEKINSSLLQIQNEINSVELILVNDGSNEQMLFDELKNLNSKIAFTALTYTENCGKGFALRNGVNKAKGKFIIYTDVDFPYTHKSFLKIYAALKNEIVDVAIGVRGEEYYKHLSKTRMRISKILRWFVKTFLLIPTNDSQCGLKGFNQKGKDVFLKTTINRYLFDLEFIFLAAKNKLIIKTVKVELREDVQLSTMSSKILLQEFGNFLKIFVKSIINN